MVKLQKVVKLYILQWFQDVINFHVHNVGLTLSSLLKSDKAIVMSIYIIETFVLLRKFAINYEGLSNRIQQIESKK